MGTVEEAPEFEAKKELWLVPVTIYSRKGAEIGPHDVNVSITSLKGAVHVRVNGKIETRGA